jgi:hypothetical protein
MKVELADSFLVWQVFESLPSQFDAHVQDHLQCSERWMELHNMTAIVTQEEEARW